MTRWNLLRCWRVFLIHFSGAWAAVSLLTARSGQAVPELSLGPAEPHEQAEGLIQTVSRVCPWRTALL